MRLPYLQKVMTEPDGEYEWIGVLQDFWTLYHSKEVPLTPEEITVLEIAAKFHGNVKLTHMYDGPHSAPPDKMIRQAAVQTLLQRLEKGDQQQ